MEGSPRIAGRRKPNYCERFLLRPRTIGGERRWLEWATWEQVVSVAMEFEGPDSIGDIWHDSRWID